MFMLDSFRVRSFRYQWPADLLTSWAFEMETLILSWYVLVDTGSVLLLTAFGALQFLGTLAAPMFGVLGDRLGVRTMLCAMRACYAVLAGTLMLLALAGVLAPAWVLVVALLTGIVRPNDQVMRNALIGETIPPRHLMGALGLSRASMDSARVVGALVGAGLSAALGVGRAFVFVSVCYAVAFLLTLGVARSPIMRARPGTEPSRYRDLVDGLRYVATTPALLAPMLLAFLINLCAYPVTSGLLPYVAQRVYHVDATGLGSLSASFAAGALVGSIALVATGGPSRPERAMLIYAAMWYALLIAFTHVASFRWGLAILALAGLVQSIAMISLMATVLEAAGPRFRTRVVGVRMLAVYGLPLGLMGMGAVIDRFGYATTIGLSCVVGLGCTFLIGWRWRASVWRRAPVNRPADPSIAV